MPTTVTGARPPSNAVAVLAATRLTPDVRAACPLSGCVRSVHRAAIYVDLSAPQSPLSLLVLAIDDVGGVPGGALVGGADDLRRTGIRRGMAVVASSRGVAIPAARVEIDFVGAITWSPTLPHAGRLRPTPELARSVTAARRLAATHASPGGLAPTIPGVGRALDPWLARAAHLIDRQLTALATADLVTAADATVELIGLGAGLTPSGDDYLVGLLAGLEATGDPVRGGLAAAIVAHADNRTTAIGAAALRHAAAGAYAERLHDVLVALARAEGGGQHADGLDGLAPAIERAMAYGATSGGDTLVGLFAALDLALPRATRLPVAAA